MKKLSLFIAALTMAAPIPLTLATPAQAASSSGNVEFCKDYVAAGYDANLNVGECVSLLNTQDHYYTNGKSGGGYAAHACSYVQQNYPDVFDASYGSFSECVRDGASAFI